MSEIKIELIEPKDVPELVSFFKENFFKNEPNCEYLNIGPDCKELEEFCVKSVPENCSFKAVNSKGEIVGALTNGIVKKPTSGQPQANLADACKHEKFKKILKIVDFIDSKFNLFNVYPNISKYLDAKVMSVDGKYHGQGIGTKLVKRTIEHMRANNIPVISMLCTSFFSAHVCEKLNFKRVYGLKYADYVVDGKNPLLPADPHKAVQIFAKEVK